MAAPSTALVCSGGGARGAYEAGIIRYLREELPASVRPHVHFDVLCGTSVGAITNCFLAASAERPDEQGRDLSAFWTELRSMGHALAVREPDFMPHHFASPTGIARDAATGELRGGADPYAQGVAAGF